MTDFRELTTLRVGGPIERLLEPVTTAELIETVLAVWSEPRDFMLLGGGSNLVVADEGFEGTVVRIATRGIERAGDGSPRIRVQAGEPWDGVVAFAVGAGLSGIESLSGIPGTTGAGPIQNIGAYGQQLGDTLVAIEFLDFDSGAVERLTAADLDLGYRTSALKQGRLGVVLSVELALASDDGLSAPIAYDQLATRLGVELGARAPLADVRAAVLALRQSKGMVWDPADPDSISAGSFFTNPIVSENFARGLPADAPRYPTEPEAPPRVLSLGEAAGAPFTVGDPGTRDVTLATNSASSGEYLVKLSAAWLIERAGIRRGFALPGSGAAISSKHTLAIINRGHATAADVAQLAGYVQTRVLSEFGVMLQPEPVMIGVEA